MSLNKFTTLFLSVILCLFFFLSSLCRLHEVKYTYPHSAVKSNNCSTLQVISAPPKLVAAVVEKQA